MRRAATALVLLFFATAMAQGGEVVKSSVKHRAGHYLIHMTMQIAAPAEFVYDHFTDFDRLQRVNNNILESEVLESRDGYHRLRVVSEGCAMLFCKRMVQTQEVREFQDGYIVATVVPEGSDFKSGTLVWHIRPDSEAGDGMTRVDFNADLEPDFWVPPVIGPWLVKRAFYTESKETLAGLEQSEPAAP
ncbi:MAG: SRPBCC family protein [Pseudomonadota bacterium]|nr:MAG: SRPBCC family protein [Pseudomonadota bacterium]